MSRSRVDIDLKAIQENVGILRSAAGGAELCAVVKANGYGHGAVEVAKAAVAGGATWLAIAQVEEARVLRDAGLQTPILVLSEPAPEEFPAAVAFDLHVTVYTANGVDAAQAAAAETNATLPIHLKVDTGMHRVGAALGDGVKLATSITACTNLDLVSVWTHLATSEDVEHPLAAQQLDRFDALLGELQSHNIDVVMTHTANSGAILAQPRAHRELVRSGIGLYGLSPGGGLGRQLHPALRWVSNVSMVKRLPAGSSVSYGQRGSVQVDSNVATVPVGYADGYRRDLWSLGGCVLIGGKRRPIIGVVTMDQFVVDCGDDDVKIGDEVVLLGRQGDEHVPVSEMASWLGTIEYEVVCAIGDRVERRYRS